MSGHSLEETLKNVILPEIRFMAYGSAQYLAFGQIAVGIELFGACADTKPLQTKRVSRQRFELGITRYMAQVDSRYAHHIGNGTKFDLYYHLRCGMAHLLRPQGKIGFTSRSDTARDGTTNLGIVASHDALILVIEEFYDHFHTAAELFITDIPNLEPLKVSGVFLPVQESEA